MITPKALQTLAYNRVSGSATHVYIFLAINPNTKFSTQYIAEFLGYSVRTIRRSLSTLKDLPLI